jgi:hypothetical protein
MITIPFNSGVATTEFLFTWAFLCDLYEGFGDVTAEDALLVYSRTKGKCLTADVLRSAVLAEIMEWTDYREPNPFLQHVSCVAP